MFGSRGTGNHNIPGKEIHIVRGTGQTISDKGDFLAKFVRIRVQIVSNYAAWRHCLQNQNRKVRFLFGVARVGRIDINLGNTVNIGAVCRFKGNVDRARIHRFPGLGIPDNVRRCQDMQPGGKKNARS